MARAIFAATAGGIERPQSFSAFSNKVNNFISLFRTNRPA